jgi:hypothetical protein
VTEGVQIWHQRTLHGNKMIRWLGHWSPNITLDCGWFIRFSNVVGRRSWPLPEYRVQNQWGGRSWRNCGEKLMEELDLEFESDLIPSTMNTELFSFLDCVKRGIKNVNLRFCCWYLLLPLIFVFILIQFTSRSHCVYKVFSPFFCWSLEEKEEKMFVECGI